MRSMLIATILASLTTTIALAPAVMAATYQNSGSIAVTYGLPNLSSSHVYEVTLASGDSLTATVSWDDPNTDLDLLVRPPGSGCGVLPEPEVECIALLVASQATSISCLEGGYTGGVGPSSETVTVDTAEVGGVWQVTVVAATAVPTSTVPYDLEIDVNDGDGEALVDGPTESNLIRLNGHCRL